MPPHPSRDNPGPQTPHGVQGFEWLPTLYVPSGHGSHDPGDTPRSQVSEQPVLYDPETQAAQAVQAWEPSALLYLPGAHLDRSLYHSAVLVQHLLTSVSELRRYLSYSAANLPRSWIAPGTQFYTRTRIALGTRLDYPAKDIVIYSQLDSNCLIPLPSSSCNAPDTQVYPQTRIAPGTQLNYPPRTELEVATACEPRVAHAL